MPLLKRKAFEKSAASGYLRDDDEVFHCEITDEIFKDYEEYCERIILVNSMVWSCEMTGKNNLTYAEALESEKAARRSLKDFPMELRIPILYLAAKTNRSSFADMSEDVFNFVRERYFVGETVESCLEGDIWRESHVLSVTVQKQQPGTKATPPAASYCYEVEQFESSGAGTVGAAPHDRVRRRKGVFGREKCRLFLKQFVEMEAGIVGIKKSALEKYNIAKVNYEQIFVGRPPDFPSSKKLLKTPPSVNKKSKPGSAGKLNSSAKKGTPDKKKQESMDKFLKKPSPTDAPSQKKPGEPAAKKSADNSTKKSSDPTAKKSAQDLANKMRHAEEQMRQRREEEKARKKEKTAKIQAYLKEWQKVKDDLQLEDHKIIPKGTPLCIVDIPQQHIGDFLSVLEFVQLYAEQLKTKDVFHGGLDLETFRKALTVKESAGLFSDLIQMFMTTIFSLQEDEAEEYNEGGRIDESTQADEVEGEMGVTKAVELATKACKWSQTYLGTPLSKLPLDPTTITEVVRLHILSSGAAPGSRCATWRYQQRGGYSSLDDAGLRLRVTHPAILRRLRTTHAHDLPLDEKLLLLQCLMNQILSYATVRDVIEEKIEAYKSMKHELRTMQIAERRREVELVATKSKLKKEAAAKKEEQKLTGDAARAVDKQLQAELEKLTVEGEDKKLQYRKRQAKLQYECFQHHSFIGSDRAYRRYWLHRTVPGLLVEAGAELRGPCLDKPVPPPPAARGDDTLAYVTELFETRGGSDKENESNANSRGNSPKKPLSSLNGLAQKLNGLENGLQHMRELLVCTGDTSSCFVHGTGDFRPQWWVYHTEEQVDGLIQSLNKRGVRESELRAALELDKASIVDYIKKCPLHLLNPTVGQPPPPPVTTSTRRSKYQPSLLVPSDSSVSEALELSLRDYILELEEKIFHGCLGAIKVKDREAWRGTIMLRGYDKQAEFLSWGPHQQYRDDYHLPNGVLKAPPDDTKADGKQIPELKYRDPGHFLGEVTKLNGLNQEPGVKAEAAGGQPAPDVVRGLASALLQIEQGIHHKYLKRPLGLDDKERKEREAKGKALDMDALERWEVSLMESASFAQIFLHLFTLDSSVTWSASILNASCRICRRKTDPDNMLLCDSCNKGHHMYCLKPKLTKVPQGDWFCEQCKPKQERTPRKRRKLFSDEDVDEAANDESAESFELDVGVCARCGSGGRLAAVCVCCTARYHAECAAPPPGRAARRWICDTCLNPPRERRRCAAEARSNITEYTRALNDTIPDTSESEDSEDNTALVQLTRKSRHSHSASPAPQTNGHARPPRARKSKNDSNLDTSKKSRKSGSRTPVANGVHEERGKKRAAAGAGAGALHAAELQTLLRDVMKHKDCWPFYVAVNTDEVPDYLDVIEQPMDFTTIKEKLSANEYTADDQLIRDATLVFVNCYTYNKDTHPVALAGTRLEEYFNKRCKTLGLPCLPEIDLSEAAPAPASAPPAKRAKNK